VTGPENVNGQWWTRIQLPEGVYAEVEWGHDRHSVCLYGANGQAITETLRDWSAFPHVTFDPPEQT